MYAAISNVPMPSRKPLTVFGLLAVTVLVANLLADLTYGVLDPRVRHGARISA